MPINLFDRSSKAELSVVIVSAACCVPGMEPFDEAARKIIEQAIAETGVSAKVTLLPATRAFFGGAPRQVMAEIIKLAQAGHVPVPAVLINWKPVSYGVPEPAAMKSALLEAGRAYTDITKEVKTNESAA